MSSCVAVPTETQFQVVTTTSESLSTSFSIAVTTLQPTVETSILPCSGSSSNSACSASTLLVTNAAATSTNTVAVTVTVPVTFTTANPIRTLFSTSCSSSPTPTSINSAPTVQPSQSTPTSSSAPPPAASSSPPPSSASDSSPLSPALSSSAFTLSNGSVVTSQVAVTATSPGSSTSVVSSPSPSLNPSGTGGGSLSSSKTGPIVGGVVGGVVALLGIIGCIWFFWRRRSKRWDDLLEKEEYEEQRRPRMTLTGEDAQPRPYHYGLVGHSGTPSPPGSPPLGAAELGHSPSNSLSRLNAPHARSRSTSGDAISSMTRSMSDLNASQVGSIRPWTASSAAASTPLLERTLNHARSPSIPTADLLGVGAGALTPRPQSAGGSGQGGSGPAFGASTAPVPPLPISSADEKRRLRAALPQGAAPPTPPARDIESAGASPPVQSPRGETRAPAIRPRDPKRPAKNASTVTVHVDGGPAAEPDPRSPPGSSEPPAYSPT